jgi:hypothetical protein
MSAVTCALARPEEADQPRFDGRFILEFALPDNMNSPAVFDERRVRNGVPLLCARDFRSPVIRPRAHHAGGPTRMAVPEAAVDEYDGAPWTEHNVGVSRKLPGMKPKAVSLTVEQPPHAKLWRRIPRPDTAHNRRSLFRRDRVCQWRPAGLSGPRYPSLGCGVGGATVARCAINTCWPVARAPTIEATRTYAKAYDCADQEPCEATSGWVT